MYAKKKLILFVNRVHKVAAQHILGRVKKKIKKNCVWHRVNYLCVHACKFVYVQFMFMFILKVTVYTTVDGNG